MPRAIHQLLSVFNPDDAQGHMALFLRDIFSRWGYKSAIFAGEYAPGANIKARTTDEILKNDNPHDFLLYHASINSNIGEIFCHSNKKQVLIYHNITPARYFYNFDLFTYLECRKGRRDLSRFIPTCDLALADSTFNKNELQSLGFPRVELLPFPFDRSRLDGPTDNAIMQKYNNTGQPNILFVGRIAPNKRQEDILSVFYFLQAIYQPEANLILVGPEHIPNYANFLKEKIRRLGLKNVVITGQVTAKELRAYYRSADIFLCLSEHEGYCVPLMESLYYHIPVIAYAAGAVPETLDGSGILIDRKDPPRIAALINRILLDSELRGKIIRGQNQRLKKAVNYNYEEVLKSKLFADPPA